MVWGDVAKSFRFHHSLYNSARARNSAIEMTQSASVILPMFELGDFPFAPMGEDGIGTLPNTYTSLARWESEGGRLHLSSADLGDQSICQILVQV